MTRPGGSTESLPGWLAHPRVAGWASLAAVALCLPALWIGFRADDWMQQALLAGLDPLGEPGSPVWDFFAFADGDPERNRKLTRAGIFPWWSTPTLEMRFMRPLAALTHLVDHLIAPGAPMFAHAHSLLWLALLVWLAGRLYRRLLGAGAVAGLAALIFAFDGAHGFPVGWIANRNALITGSAGVAVLLLHDRYVRDGWRPGAALAPLALTLGLLAGEAAVAAVGWLVAYALFVDRRTTAERLWSLAPALLVTGLWRIGYAIGGFGTHGQGLYTDPVTDPAGFVGELPARMVALFADQLLRVPSLVFSFVEPDTSRVLLLALAIALGAVAWGLLRVLHKHPSASFWAAGLLASAVPVCATFPATRLLTFVALGAAPLLAAFVARALPAAHRPARALALLIVGLHVVVAALVLPLRSVEVRAVSGVLIDPCDRFVSDEPDIADKTVVFVNANGLCVSNIVYRRLVERRPRPAALRMLGHGIHPLRLRGIDPHTVELHIVGGMRATPIDSLFQPCEPHLALGEAIDLGDLRLTVVSTTASGHVERVRARFRRPLRDPDLLWIASRSLGLQSITPPSPGETIELPPTLEGARRQTVLDAIVGGSGAVR